MPNPAIRFSGYLAPFSTIDEEHPVLHLIVDEVAAIWPRNSSKVLVDIMEFDSFIDVHTKQLRFEGGAAPKDDLLASFEALLVRRDDLTFYFDEIQPRDGKDYSQKPEGNIPWFKLKFCVAGTAKDNLDANPSPQYIIPILNPENAEYEGGSFEMGFSFKAADTNRNYGNSSAWPSLVRVPRHFLPPEYETSLLYLESVHALMSERYPARSSTPASDHTATPITGRTDEQILMDKQLLLSRLDEILVRIEDELPWRRDRAARDQKAALLNKAFAPSYRRPEDKILECGIAKFCDQLDEMARYAGYQTWNLEDLIFFQSSTCITYGNRTYRILTGRGMLDWFKEVALAIINLCAT